MPLLFAALNIGPLDILIVLILLAIPWMIVARIRHHMNSRPCLRCGERVRNGDLRCEACGFDFASVGASPPGAS